MKRLFLPLILFFLLVMEGVALELLPSTFINGDWNIIPHWVLIFLILIAMFYDRTDTYVSVAYAIIFGLLFDIVYTEIIGVYMFTYAVIIYLIHGLMKFLHDNFYVTLGMMIGGMIATDGLIYFIYIVIGMVDSPWNDYFIYRLVPTLIANLLFLIIIYPFTKLLVKWRKEYLST